MTDLPPIPEPLRRAGFAWHVGGRTLVNDRGRIEINGVGQGAIDVALQMVAGLPAAWKKQLYRGELLPAERAELLARLRAALRQIAERPDAEMQAARTLHYDMRGWARKALEGSNDTRSTS